VAEDFPSSTFGPDYIRALKAVLPPEVPVLAVGGVTPENLATWVQAGAPAPVWAAIFIAPGRPWNVPVEQAAQAVNRPAAAVDAAAVAVERQLNTAQPAFAWVLLAIASSVASTSTIASIA
jgi:2-dehydro-3-deoxyphosphogalactonate aldolase